MVRTSLPLKAGHDYIAVNVEGIPLGRYAPQIFHLLYEQGLGDICKNLAEPILTPQGIASQWLCPTSVEVMIPWREASLAQQLNGVEQLISMVTAIESLRRELAPAATRSLVIIDNILKNLTVIPSTDTIFFVEGRPLLSYWGYYSQQRKSVDFSALQAALRQALAEISPPEQPDNTLLPAPIQVSAPAHKKFSARYAYVVVSAMLLCIVTFLFQAKPLKTVQPLTHSPAIIAPTDQLNLSLKAMESAILQLPLQKASYRPTPTITKSPLSKHSNSALMIPSQSRYQGNADFLDGTWRADIQENDRIIRLSYRFKQGRARTTIENGPQRCVTSSKAAFSATGQLAILGAKARCNDHSRYPAISLICENSEPNTQCFWKKNSSTTRPIVLYREIK